MTVRFNHPPVIGGNPFQNFNPNDLSQYPSGSGVYIYGFRKIINDKRVFIPLYVGISKSLKSRLWQHYVEERSGGNSKWYVFDYDSINHINDVVDLYSDMRIADSLKGINNLRYSNKLIWFNDSTFFNYKLNIHNGSNYFANSGVLSSVLNGGDLDNINNLNPNNNAKDLKDKILKSKAIFDNDFYFIYSSIDSSVDISIDDTHELYEIYNHYKIHNQYMDGRKNGSGRKLCEKIEHITKSKLKQIKIDTAAKSHGKICPVSINFSSVQDCLVNIGGNNFNDQKGDYTNPLIL